MNPRVTAKDRAWLEDCLTLFGTLLLAFFGYYLFSELMGGKIFEHQPQDSYTIQTINWLQGRSWLEGGENYTWLELAIYEGKYWCSFPPVPSVIMLPLALVFGYETPNNLLVCVYGLISIALGYRIMRKTGRSPRTAAFWGLFLVWGSNMLWMTTDGGVWFQAQALCMVFCTGAVLAAICRREGLSLTLLALAVGCRPFSAVFLPVFLFLFAWKDRENGFVRALLRRWKSCIGPAVVAAGLMAYNTARFGNPLEFGHNYLPEFVEAEHGQFALCYLWPNLKTILFEPVQIVDGSLSFPLFNGFMFYVANPLFLVLFFFQLRAIRRREYSPEGISLTIGLVLELVLLCMHKTFGGWQFGCRYTCDLLPFAFAYIALKGREKLSGGALLAGIAGIAFNCYGVIYMYLYG